MASYCRIKKKYGREKVNVAMIDFFNSNFFIALITLVVGSFAIYIYRKQQRDFKRNAANTIWLEIKTAEKLLDEAKRKIGESRRQGLTQIPEHHYVMPMESWSKYKSLLSKDLTDDQWDRISRFYNDCQLFDETVEYSDKVFIKDTDHIRKNVHEAMYKYASMYTDIIDLENDETKKVKLVEDMKRLTADAVSILTHKDYIQSYTPSKPVKDIEMLVDTMETNLSIGDVGQV